MNTSSASPKGNILAIGPTLPHRIALWTRKQWALVGCGVFVLFLFVGSQVDVVDGKEHQKNVSEPAAGGALSFPLIARTVDLSMVVKDSDAFRTALDALLIRCAGYPSDLTIANPQDAPRSLQASLRIPAAQLEVASKELKSLGRSNLKRKKEKRLLGHMLIYWHALETHGKRSNACKQF